MRKANTKDVALFLQGILGTYQVVNCCKLFKKDQPLLQMFRYNNFANIQVTFDQPPFASIQITFASIFSNVSLFYTPNLKSRKASGIE